ncbi:hypothetical protein AAFP30_01365 [Gordonia sp. CPCC 205515]|uniref:hypothetical protein n=1 Tax=Gordonia sp. CPCC 205515 TaxID=3140791 RepID=UPI003AF34D17
MTDDDAPNIRPADGDDDRPADPPPTGGKHAKGDRDRGIFRKRQWHHIPRTRIRTSTAVMVVVFFGLLTLYGWTSQHYGVVAPVQQPAPTRTTTTTTPPYTYSSEPTSSLPSVSRPRSSEANSPGESGTDGTGVNPAPAPETSNPGYTVPGLPGVTIPRFGQPATPTPTETTPTR